MNVPNRAESPDNNNDDDEQIHTQLSSILAVVRCAAHTIQLAANDVIKRIQSELEECRKAIKILRVYVRGRADFRMPTLDNVTRWNSTFDMINTLFNLKIFIECNEDVNVSELNWKFIENFISSFKPLAECSKKFQSEQYVIGDF